MYFLLKYNWKRKLSIFWVLKFGCPNQYFGIPSWVSISPWFLLVRGLGVFPHHPKIWLISPKICVPLSPPPSPHTHTHTILTPKKHCFCNFHTILGDFGQNALPTKTTLVGSRTSQLLPKFGWLWSPLTSQPKLAWISRDGDMRCFFVSSMVSGLLNQLHSFWQLYFIELKPFNR